MGLLDRIAGTLDELTRDATTPGGARDELDLAVAFAERGDLALAEERLRDLAVRFPKLGAVHRHLGDVLSRRGELEAAIDAYGRAVDRDADDPRGWFGLGTHLARAGRFEPARDGFRRTLALAVDDEQRRQAHAALGNLFAADGQLGRAARELHKALLLGPDDATLEAAYGRVLVRDGERTAGAAHLTRAARADGSPPGLFIEAADATEDGAAAEALLREGLLRAPAHPGLRAALARRLTDGGRPEEGLALALQSLAAAPADPATLAAVRTAYAHLGRWTEALRAARREAELGAPPPWPTRLALALGTQDRAALADLLAATTTAGAPADSAGDVTLIRAARAFADGAPGEADVRALAALAPDDDARRFVAHALAPPAPPAGHLISLLQHAHDLATRTPALESLAVTASRATEAFDRPLLVAVMGEFNAGKSSFVNALCGAPIAPVGVTPTTATVNILRYGPPGGRILFQDGTARDLDADAVGPFLSKLGDADAAAIRVVEIFTPLELLRRVEVVDTPGLNSLRPAHEKVARDFLVDADAIVWLFAVGQAAKASEQQALRLAHDAGKRVLGVLNKVDRADPGEIAAVQAHVAASVGPLLDGIVPLAARAALDARRAGDDDALATSGILAVEEALELRFFRHARELKRATAVAALRRFVGDAQTAIAAAPAAETPAHAAAARATLATVEEHVRGALGTERVALRARIDEAYRGAAFEVRDFVRPRAWLFGEHRAETADEEFLIDLLDEAIARATRGTRAALLAAIDATTEAASTPSTDDAGAARVPRAALLGAIDAAVERFAAYARGVIEGGAVAEFFRQDLPRVRLDVGAIRTALARRAPEPEAALFAPLARDLDRVFHQAAEALQAAALDATVTALLSDERLRRPVDELARAIGALAADAGPAV